jgi:hypothetical protein
VATYSKDKAARSISIGAAIPASSPKENAGRTPANPGTTTGPGDVFVYIPAVGQGYQYAPNLSWDVSVAGGTMTALVVTLEGSNDNFTTVSTIDTSNSITGGARAVANPGFQAYRANIGTFTANVGSPVCTVGIMF